MKRKIKKILLILFMFLISITNYEYAAVEENIEFKVEVGKTQIEKNEEVKLSLKFDLPERISWKVNTYKAKIEYDKNIFEEISVSNLENKNNWENIRYNSQNGEFIATNAGGITKSEEIVNIRLKCKSNIQETNTAYIIISDVETANTNTNEVIKIRNIDNQLEEKIEITINKDLKEQSSNWYEGILPKLGEEIDWLYVLLWIILIIAVVVLFIIKRKSINNKNKKIFMFVLALVMVPDLIYAQVIDGDFNGNEALNANDIVILEDYLIDLNFIGDKVGIEKCDINKDNKINLVDLSLLVDLCNEKINDSNQEEQGKEEGNKEAKIKIETTELGIGGCGMLFSPKISPFDSNTMLVISDMGGVYLSYNKGQTWERRELNGTCYTACFDTNQKGVIYAGGSGLYRSEDNGKTFNLIFPKEEKIIATPNKYESGMRYLYTTQDYPTVKVVKSILVDPEDSNHIYVLMYYNKEGIIYESKDNGGNFEPIVTYNKNKFSSNIIYDYNEMFLHNGNLRYITQDGICEYKSEEEKIENIYASTNEIIDVAQVLEDEIYYIVIEKEEQLKAKTKIHYTKDFITFTDLTQKVIDDLPKSFDTYYYKDVEFDWNFKHIEATSLENIYLTQGSYSSNSAYPYGIEGIIKYDGKKFSWLYGNPFRDRSYLENRAWTDGSYSMYGITSDPQNEDAILFTTLCGVYYSPDSEKMYQRYSNVHKENGEVKYSTNGINVQTTYGVERDPFDENHIMLLNTDLGLISSDNNGQTWTRANDGIKESWSNTVYDLEFDKEKQGVVYSIWSSRHDAPYEAYANETDNKYGGFAISYDGGENWDSRYSSGLPENVTPVKLSVVYSENSEERTIYLATFNEGFFVSYDSGKHFEEMNQGIEKVTYNKDSNTKYEYIFGADIESMNDRIFALTAKSNYNNKEQAGKVYEWINGFWNEIGLPKNTICPRDLYYKNGVLYISATATYVFDYKTPGVDFSNYGGGIYTYIDGKTKQIYDETISIAGVQIDSKGNMYASDIYGNVYLKNEENYFKKIYSNYHSISKGIILEDDETLYLPTFGGGLLRMKISYSK